MQSYRSGEEFEKLFFGRHSSGRPLRIAEGEEISFDETVRRIEWKIRRLGIKHPPTQMGSALYWRVIKELQKLGVDASGLILAATVDSDLDLGFEADGLFLLPAVDYHPVTIDLFNIDTAVLPRDIWIDTSEGDFSWSDYQSALFQFKSGMARWKNDNLKALEEGFIVSKPLDLRTYANKGRHKNHFILTPYDVGTYVGRRGFAKNLAGHFASKVASHEQETALLSHK